MQQLKDSLANAYTTLRATTQNLQEAVEETIKAKRDLTLARQAIINQHSDDPKRLGGNEAAREARLNELTSDHLLDLQRAEDDERRARNLLTLAQLDLEAARAQLRVLELAAGREVVA